MVKLIYLLSFVMGCITAVYSSVLQSCMYSKDIVCISVCLTKVGQNEQVMQRAILEDFYCAMPILYMWF